MRIIIICISFVLINCNIQKEYRLESNAVVACIGDSVTNGGGNGYVEYLQKYVDENQQDKNITFLNWGKNSETITNLTELDHPGPRPYLFDRLDVLLNKSPKPDVVTFCYGINCGIYGKPSEELFKKYKDGLTLFLDTMRANDIDVVLMTPPPLVLEVANKHGRQVAKAGTYSWKHPYENYDEEVIKQFKKIILDIEHPSIITKIDIYTPLVKNVDKSYGKDPIHPNRYGSEIIANTITKVLF